MICSFVSVKVTTRLSWEAEVTHSSPEMSPRNNFSYQTLATPLCVKPLHYLTSVPAGSLSNQLLSQRIYNYVNKSSESVMLSIHVLCLPGKSQLQLRRQETESMSTGHWAKNKELRLSPGLYQNIYRVSGLLGAWIRKAGLWVSLRPTLKQHTQKQMRGGQALQHSTRDLRVPEAKTFLVLRDQCKDESHYSKWTCGCRKVNDWIPHSLMLGEITGTRWDLCGMTRALHNYLAITIYHFYAHDCLRIYLNCFYFSVLYFSSCQMNCLIDN